MKQLETEHYIFHFEPGSTAERDIAQIAAGQEACYRYICNVLKVEPDFKLEYFLCQTPEDVGRAYGDDETCNGFAARPNKIYAVYNDQVKCIGFHEDAHLISYCHNRPYCPAVTEGLAMYFDRKWWGIHNMDWTAYYLRSSRYVSLDKLYDRETFFSIDDSVSYPIVGAFTEYLLATYGIETFLTFYRRNGNMAEEFERVYGKSVSGMNEEFVNYIRLFRLDEAVAERITRLIEERVC